MKMLRLSGAIRIATEFLLRTIFFFFEFYTKKKKVRSQYNWQMNQRFYHWKKELSLLTIEKKNNYHRINFAYDTKKNSVI